ncbi:hypothetical protein RIF29_00187 [Crotalaria pallida]|uniref:Cytochrome P450 n=1 Tax=Crotalaria pallida TaxID=3830 RepID=A0AAN9IVF5_CROPI
MELSSLIFFTLILAVVPIWALKKLNTLWLRPKRLEKLLRAQGLQGDPYKLPSIKNLKQLYMLKIQEEAKSKSIGLSNASDVAPHVFLPTHHTVNKYGKKSFLWEGTTPEVVITEPEQVKEVFSKIQDFPKPKSSPLIKLLRIGLASYEGEKWAKHRKIINPFFHSEKLKGMLPSFFQSYKDMVSKWEEMLSSDGRMEIDVWPSLQNLTCDIISRIAFGSTYEEGTKIFELLKKEADIVIATRHRHNTSWFILTATNRKIKKLERELQDAVGRIVKKRREAMKNGEGTEDDLLGILLESNNNEHQGNENNKAVVITDQEVVNECKHIYLAGQETTSTLLVWTMILLGKYPEWQTRAREEVLQVFGDRDPDFDGLSRLKIVTMILNEVLRLYSPAIYFKRDVRKDVKLGTLQLPAGVQVSLPILLIHQDHDLWGDDAKEFRPERFSEGISKAAKGQVPFFAFSYGPRNCIGQNFAMLEAKMIFSLLLRNFSFELSPAYVHLPTTMLTLQPKHGAHIILQKL